MYAFSRDSVRDTAFITMQTKYAASLWKSNPDSLIILCNQTFALSEKKGFNAGKIEACLCLGSGYYEKGKYTESITWYENAIKLAQIHHDAKNEARSMSNISKPLISMGSQDKALDYLYKALMIAEKIGDKITEAHILHNIGMVYHYQDKYEQAVVHYLKSKTIYEENGDSTKTTFILGNIGHIYLSNKQYKKAESYYLLSYELSLKFKNNKAISNALISLGNYYSELNQQDRAISYYLQALQLIEKSGEQSEYLRLLDNMAKCYHQQNKLKLAFKYAKLSYQLALEQKQIYYVSSSSNLLSELYEKFNQPKLALEYYKKFKIAEDSLYSSSNKEELVRLKEKYTFEKRQQVITSEYQNSLNRKQLLIYTVSLMVLLLIVTSSLLLKNNKEKKKANLALQGEKLAVEKKNISLKKMDSFKRQLISLMAHDIRTPIANVKIILLLFSGSNDYEKRVQRLIQSSQIEIDSLILLIDNLLLWITCQLNDQKIQKTYFSLETITAEIFSLYRLLAENKGIKLSMQIEKNIEVYADIEALKIIIRNLVSNAIKFCHHGDQIMVISEWDKTTNKIIIRISDTGIGMSVEELKLALKGDGVTQEGTSQEKGIGIGLQLCLKYVELNNSELFAKSLPGEGSEFWFSIIGRNIKK